MNESNKESKISEALDILKIMELPKAQQNERSSLTLLALLNLKPTGKWSSLESPLLGVTPIMDWVAINYSKEYAPNTRETFRRQTLHQFVDAGIVLYNPDNPDRPVNSPKACYQVEPNFLKLLKSYGTKDWKIKALGFLKMNQSLQKQYAMVREMSMIDLKINEEVSIKLSPGEHSKLIADIVEQFGPRFVPGASLIYVGDTGDKVGYFQENELKKLDVTLNKKGKMPDVIMYYKKKNWLVLIESVTSHGPVDGKRYNELNSIFKNSKAGLVFVTALPSREVLRKFLTQISWESEVWIAEAPGHMIHFNGDKFLGPYK